MSLGRICHAQLLVDSTATDSGKVKKIIWNQEAAFACEQVRGKTTFYSRGMHIFDPNQGH